MEFKCSGLGCKAKKTSMFQWGYEKYGWISIGDGYLCPRCQKRAEKAGESERQRLEEEGALKGGSDMTISVEVAKVSGAVRVRCRFGSDCRGVGAPAPLSLEEFASDTLAFAGEEKKKIKAKLEKSKGR